MKKKKAIEQITWLSGLAVNHLNDVIKYRRSQHLESTCDFCRGLTAGVNNAIAFLARDAGIASPVWDKPAELAKAA